MPRRANQRRPPGQGSSSSSNPEPSHENRPRDSTFAPGASPTPNLHPFSSSTSPPRRIAFESNSSPASPRETKNPHPSSPIPDRGHSDFTDSDKMDPFEVRIRFTGQLQNLNASVTSAVKAAQYALKYRDMDEDLHSCILEQLERNTMNTRANIMFFIEHLCDMASRENHLDYIRMMQRDILRIVDAVAPDDGSGAANVKVVRKVLQGLQGKNYLLLQTVTEIEDILKERDAAGAGVDVGMSSPVAVNGEVAMSGMATRAEDLVGSGAPTPTTKSKHGSYPAQKLDKKQIEQRIEEDRERHKRQRETSWAIQKPVLAPGLTVGGAMMGVSDREFADLWEGTSDVGEDDFDLYEEEKMDREACAKEWKDEWKALHGAGGAPGAGGGKE